MSTPNNGGAAFPRPGSDWMEQGGGVYAGAQRGMTLRDYFAAKAMPELLRQNECAANEKIAAWAYQVADAMLQARALSNIEGAE